MAGLGFQCGKQEKKGEREEESWVQDVVDGEVRINGCKLLKWFDSFCIIYGTTWHRAMVFQNLNQAGIKDSAVCGHPSGTMLTEGLEASSVPKRIPNFQPASAAEPRFNLELWPFSRSSPGLMKDVLPELCWQGLLLGPRCAYIVTKWYPGSYGLFG